MSRTIRMTTTTPIPTKMPFNDVSRLGAKIEKNQSIDWRKTIDELLFSNIRAFVPLIVTLASKIFNETSTTGSISLESISDELIRFSSEVCLQEF